MDELNEAWHVALKFLEPRMRTRSEVATRLERGGFERGVVEETLAALERADLLDDERFSREWIEGRSEVKGYGRIRLAAELRHKGIGKEQIEESLGNIDAEMEYRTALAQAKKRLGASDPQDRAVRRRISSFLLRRGYNWEIIEQVFDELSSN